VPNFSKALFEFTPWEKKIHNFPNFFVKKETKFVPKNKFFCSVHFMEHFPISTVPSLKLELAVGGVGDSINL
jgi:hypothetical protein